MKKKVYIFAEDGWAVGRIHHDLEKYLSDEFEFIFVDWGNQGKIYENMKSYEECDIFLTVVAGYNSVFSWWPNINVRKCLFISHGAVEMEGIKFLPLATHGMTSRSIEHLFPDNITHLFTPNCVELDNFTRKEHSGAINRIGWCGAPHITSKQFHWAREIAKNLNTELHVSSKTPFEDSADWKAMSFDDLVNWYTTLDILLITSVPTKESETGPLPAFEAIASGVVVIGTPVGNFAELPGPKFSTVEEAISILNDLKTNPEKVKQIANDQYTCIVEKWNYRVVSHHWRHAFYKVIENTLHI